MNGTADHGATKVLLLAGGLGTRLRPLTDRMPKCLVPILGRPLLDYWFDRFAEAGLRQVLINNHHLPDQLRRYIALKNEGDRFEVHEAYEPTLLGSAGTIAANADWADDASEVLIVYGDNLSDVDLRTLISFHREHADPLTMMLFRAAQPEQCGIAELDDDHRVVNFTEKPAAPKSDLANAGVYVVDAAAYREIAAKNAFDIGFDILPDYVGRMRGWPFEGYHRDIGRWPALEQARQEAEQVFGIGARP